MKPHDIHHHFLRALEKKIPDKSKLVDLLMETLFIEKAAVQRRLRGDVSFNIYEAAKISEKLKISINNLIVTKSEGIEIHPFDMLTDFKQWEDYQSILQKANKDPFSEIAESSNILPTAIYAKFESLRKLYMFKYQYQLRSIEDRTSYSEFIVPEKISQIFQTYYHDSKRFAKTFFICDQAMFHNFVSDIHYFLGINLISGDDIKRIKEDLFALLDYLDKIALNGCFVETGNPVDVYISDINLDASYCYVRVTDIYICVVRTFLVNAVIASDKASYEKIREWVQSLKKSSTLITQSGTLYRTEFLEKQRKIIEDL